ncbi:MAG: hypothetical protein KC503_36000 [Myxococcales bacterium]|nr:hypothetical protein [Myxococcales bacterium]
MIVRCKQAQPSPEHIARHGKPFAQPDVLEAGQEYVVLALQFEVESLIWGTGAWLQLPHEDKTMVFAPMCLFEIVDGRMSQHWEMRQWEDGSVTFWPLSFYADYYHDDLRAGKADVLEDFHQVWEVLDNEARGTAPLPVGSRAAD